jgi:hypothetical protein
MKLPDREANMRKKQLSQGKIEPHVKKLNAIFEDLKTRLQKARDETHMAYQPEIEVLGRRIKEMQHRVNDLKGESEKIWEVVKAGVEKSAAEIKQSVNATLRKIAKSDQKKGTALGSSKNCEKGNNRCMVRFILPGIAAPNAESVCVVGDFNNWNTQAHCMKKDKNGNYSMSLELEKGKEYQFRYLIDGIDGSKWENDWNADRYVRSPYGGSDNSVIVV